MRFELLKARKKAGLTQEKIAQLVGITQDKYSNIETGKQVIVDAVLAYEICKVLNASMEEIFLNSNEYKLRKKSKKKVCWQRR